MLTSKLYGFEPGQTAVKWHVVDTQKVTACANEISNYSFHCTLVLILLEEF